MLFNFVVVLCPGAAVRTPAGIKSSVGSAGGIGFGLGFCGLDCVLPLLLDFLCLVCCGCGFFDSVFGLRRVRVSGGAFLRLSRGLGAGRALIRGLKGTLCASCGGVVGLLILAAVLLLTVVTLFFLALWPLNCGIGLYVFGVWGALTGGLSVRKGWARLAWGICVLVCMSEGVIWLGGGS